MAHQDYDTVVELAQSLDLGALYQVRTVVETTIREKKDAQIKAFHEKKEALLREANELGIRMIPQRANSISREPKYRNPANPAQVWSGRGKKPRWLQAELDNGSNLEAFVNQVNEADTSAA